MKAYEQYKEKSARISELTKTLNEGNASKEDKSELVRVVEEVTELSVQVMAEHNELMDKQTKRLEDLELKMNTPSFDTAAEKPEIWATEDGRECAMLRGKARLNQGGEPHTVGKVIQAALTGKHTDHTKAQVLNVDASGGYLISELMQNSVIDNARDRAVMASAGVGTIALSGDSPQGKMLRRTGADPLVSWVAERQEIAEGEVTFGLLKYRLRKCAALIELTREFTDTSNGPQLIEDAISQALGAEMDRIALLGSGAGEEPTGIANTAGIGTITSVGDINYDDFLNAIKSIRNANYEPNALIYSPGTEYELSILKETESGAYLAPPAAFNSLGKHTTKKITDALALAGQFSLSAWVIGGGGIRFEIGTDGNFKRDCVYLRVIMPLDFVVFDPTAFCLLSGLS